MLRIATHDNAGALRSHLEGRLTVRLRVVVIHGDPSPASMGTLEDGEDGIAWRCAGTFSAIWTTRLPRSAGLPAPLRPSRRLFFFRKLLLHRNIWRPLSCGTHLANDHLRESSGHTHHRPLGVSGTFRFEVTQDHSTEEAHHASENIRVRWHAARRGGPGLPDTRP